MGGHLQVLGSTDASSWGYPCSVSPCPAMILKVHACSHVFGEGVPKPVLTFEEASFPSYVLSEVVKAGFTQPTPIQSQGWPMALLGRDLIGLAETGSGGNSGSRVRLWEWTQ